MFGISYPDKLSVALLSWWWRAAGLALLILLSGPAAVKCSPPDTSLVLNRSATYSLEGHLEMLSDPVGKLNLGDMLTGETATRFRKIPGFVNRGYTSEASWIRFSLSRSSSFPHDLFLSLGPSMLDNVTVYVQTGPDRTQ